METTTIQIDKKDWKKLNIIKHKEGYTSMALLMKDIMKIFRDFQPEFRELKK